MLPEKVYKVQIKLLLPLLGTVAARKNIWIDHVWKKQAVALKKQGWTEEQIQTELETLLKDHPGDDDPNNVGFTTFEEDAEGPYLCHYMINGFLKECARVWGQWGNIKQLPIKVSRHLFCRPFKVRLPASSGVKVRALRGATPQGERICLARSDMIAEGTLIDFEIHSILDVIPENCIRDFLEYGAMKGVGQWRSAGHGSFEVVSFECVADSTAGATRKYKEDKEVAPRGTKGKKKVASLSE